MQDQPPSRARSVDVLMQRAKTDASCRQGVHGGQKLAHGSRQSRLAMKLYGAHPGPPADYHEMVMAVVCILVTEKQFNKG